MTGKQLKNSILQWAIQGKLVPQDPNDEPASVLLEKIRAEKARLVKEGKIKKDKNESIIYRGEDNSYYEKNLTTNAVKCIDDEIPFEIPKSWGWGRGEQICLPMESVKPSKDFVYIDVDAVNNRIHQIDNPKSILSNNAPSRATRRLHNGDVLFSMVRPYLRNIALVSDKYEHAIASTGFYVLSPTQDLYSKYLFYMMLSDYVVNGLNASIKGEHSPSITTTCIEEFLYPVPPVEEQHRIVSKIEDIMPYADKYERAQNDLDKLNDEIKNKLKKSILQEAIQGKLVSQDPSEGTAEGLITQINAEKQKLVNQGVLKKSSATHSTIFKGSDGKYYERKDKALIEITELIPHEIPSTWSWCRLNELCSIMSGATFKKEETNKSGNGIRILRGGNISPYNIEIKSDDLFISEDKIGDNILLRKNDIITPAVTSLENIGKMALVKSNMPCVTVGGFVFIIRCYVPVDIISQYLLMALSAPTTIEYIKSITNKSGQAFYNIGKERLLTTLIPMPPLTEQKRIVNKIDTLFESLK